MQSVAQVALGLLTLGLLAGCASGQRHLPPPSAGNADKWGKSIADYEAADRTNPPPRGAIVFVGSSSIRKWETLARDFSGLPVINRGFGGSQISDSVLFADRIVTPYHPRQVILYAGDNDIGAGKTPQQVFADYLAFTRKLHASDPRLRISFVAIKPSLKRWNLVEQGREANRLIAAHCRKDQRLDFIDIATPMLGADGKPRSELFVEDGLHLSPAGYALWRERVRPFLK